MSRGASRSNIYPYKAIEVAHTFFLCLVDARGVAWFLLRQLLGFARIVIHLQRIYNFLLFHAIILSVLDVLYALICYFI